MAGVAVGDNRHEPQDGFRPVVAPVLDAPAAVDVPGQTWEQALVVAQGPDAPRLDAGPVQAGEQALVGLVQVAGPVQAWVQALVEHLL